MARSSQATGQLVRGAFVVYNSSNSPVTGLTDSDFTKLLAKDGVDDATTITIDEIGAGRYTYTFTPATSGYWFVVIRHATHAPRGWNDEYDVA